MISFHAADRELRYDSITGFLWWKRPKKGRRFYQSAGRQDKSRHVTVVIDGKQYMAHHLIWLLQTGKWPEKETDHKNRIRSDNRWINLRPATTTQNRANSTRRKDNTSGFKGVSWHALRKKWRARVYISGKETHLGLFSTKIEARSAYIAAAAVTYGEFAHW